MKVLTKPSNDGHGYSIESGDLTNGIYKLGKLEHEAFDLIGETCEGICKYTDAYAGDENGQDKLDEKCADCPLEKLADMLWRG